MTYKEFDIAESLVKKIGTLNHMLGFMEKVHVSQYDSMVKDEHLALCTSQAQQEIHKIIIEDYKNQLEINKKAFESL